MLDSSAAFSTFLLLLPFSFPLFEASSYFEFSWDYLLARSANGISTIQATKLALQVYFWSCIIKIAWVLIPNAFRQPSKERRWERSDDAAQCYHFFETQARVSQKIPHWLQYSYIMLWHKITDYCQDCRKFPAALLMYVTSLSFCSLNGEHQV